MITKFFAFLIFVFGMRICSYAQLKFYDVDSLLIHMVYPAENGADSIVYIKENGDTIRPVSVRLPYKWELDSVFKFQVKRFFEKTKNCEVHQMVYASILFDRFKMQEVRILYGLGTRNRRYDNSIKEILKEMEDIWELPAYNDSIPIFRVVEFPCSGMMLLRKGIEDY